MNPPAHQGLEFVSEHWLQQVLGYTLRCQLGLACLHPRTLKVRRRLPTFIPTPLAPLLLRATPTAT